MSRFNRIYQIHEILRMAHQPVPMQHFIERLESSRNTMTRDFEYIRYSLGAPLIYDRNCNGYQYDPNEPVFELPGFWMSSSELYALLACEQLLESLQTNTITLRMAPLKNRIRSLLGKTGYDAEQISKRIQIQGIQARTASTQVFNPVAEATLSCKILNFQYISRSSMQTSIRTTHPQRLLHYRSNWYLLAQCEAAQALRLFSLDRITNPQVLDQKSINLPTEVVDAYTNSSFGIFGGAPIGVAHLRFSAYVAQWVAEERWHPDQVGEWVADNYELKVPFSDMRELIMDILRYGADVEVLEPNSLRQEVRKRIAAMAQIY